VVFILARCQVPFTIFDGNLLYYLELTLDEIRDGNLLYFPELQLWTRLGWKPPSFSGATTLDEIGDRKLLYFERDWE
jgi:hypothetical protein